MVKVVLAISLCSSVVLVGAETAHARLADATKVFNEIMAIPNKSISRELLDKAHCIVIVPGMSRAAFGVGVEFACGYAVCRHNRTNWGGPAGIRVENGGVGFQIGASNTDIFILVINDHGMRCLLEDKFTLGIEATVAAGPVGRQTSLSTDSQVLAEVLSWSRSKGLFAGIVLQGATLRPDTAANQELYGSQLTNKEILMGGRSAPAGVMGLITAALNRYSPRQETKK